MNFTTLQDRLRRLLLARISAGEFTGVALAARTGFQQAHISNFLNQKRSLSLDAMDQVMASLNISFLDLLDTEELKPRTPPTREGKSRFEAVALVSMQSACTARFISRDMTVDSLEFKKEFLGRLRSDTSPSRKAWTRFVLVKADADNSTAMYPRLLTGATVLIDRHYNSLKPYRANGRNLYLVHARGQHLIRYISLHGTHLSLRPQAESKPITLLEIPPGTHYPEVIIGRVCHVGMET